MIKTDMGSRLEKTALVVLAILCGVTTSWSQPSPTTACVSDTNFGGILKFDIAGQMRIFASGISGSTGSAFDNGGNLYVSNDVQPQSQTAAISDIQHIIWVWFENREYTAITATTAPYFTSFAAANVNLTNFYGVSHPSQPNYLDAFSGSNQGVTNDSYCTFPASTDNLAKQLAAAGKSWRVYAQNFPGRLL